MKPTIIFIAAMAGLSACSMKQGNTEQAITIDSTLQAKVTSILESKLEEFGAQSGQVIVMEVQTGQIKASVGTDSILQESGFVRTASSLAALETTK